MTFAVDLTLRGPMTEALWNYMAPIYNPRYRSFAAKGRTRLEATMSAISLMRSQVKREYSPQCAEWSQRALDDLRCQSSDPSAAECSVEQETSMYAVIKIGPLGPNQSIT